MGSSQNPNSLGKVAVIYGGISAEREVSLNSGRMVHEALVRQGIDAHLFDPQQQSVFELKQQGFDRAFIALHGRFGEDGCTQGALELMGIPYTGSGVMASAIAMDKVTTKRIWLEANISTPKFFCFERDAQLPIDDIIETLGLPIFVKPPHEGSSLGASKVTSPEALQTACELAWKYDSHALLEPCITGHELTCAILGSGNDAKVLPIIEIKAPAGNYDYNNKYKTNDTVYECPAQLSDDETTSIQEMVLKAYRVLNCSGWSRCDVLLDHQTRTPYLLEMNTSPGMTDHSLVPMAAKASGMNYDQLVLSILQQAKLHIQKEII